MLLMKHTHTKMLQQEEVIMARARNIKPGFFANEELVELPFHTRLLFIGLWTLCDRAGRMEDRPKRIKMALFPADDINIDESLEQLEKSGFLLRYEYEGVSYIQVISFDKHQNPHRDEKPSTIPAPCEHHGDTVAIGLIPDSLLLIPDSLNQDTPAKAVKGDYPLEFEQVWEAYPRKAGGSKKDAHKAWAARLKAGATAEGIADGVARYAAYCKAEGTEERFIKQAVTFFGVGDHYLADWTPTKRQASKTYHDLSKMDYAKGVNADGSF
jgi:hypothetical protein